jgi:lipopolysaccharide/colanic/teichoic acid biosynthesis glycosyltransferase
MLIVKRAFDIATSAIALLVLSPLFLLTALAIAIESRGPIFSIKHAYCYNNQHIRLLSFRYRTHRTQTITGRFLVRMGLDRLPMLINVLLGDISIVGPHFYTVPPPQLDGQLAIAFLNGPFRPGLLSLEGLDAGAEDELSRRDTDLFYVLNWSLMLDAKILLQHLFSRETYFRDV